MVSKLEPGFHEVEHRMSVETPEQIALSFNLAGTVSRMVAYTIDIVIRAVGVLVIGILIMAATGFAAPKLGLGLMLIIIFAVEWSYHTILEWAWNGYTPGKRILGLRVVRTNGVAVDLMRSAIRNLLRAADIFPFAYAAGVFVMFFTRTGRRLGDLVADTMVIREDRAHLRELPPLPKGIDDISLDALSLPRLKDRDLALIDEFFRRRHFFSKDRADELAEILADAWVGRSAARRHDPERLLAAMLFRAKERRSSWFGDSG
jgi:uncharacterized RDD family membrane protein YckC